MKAAGNFDRWGDDDEDDSRKTEIQIQKRESSIPIAWTEFQADSYIPARLIRTSLEAGTYAIRYNDRVGYYVQQEPVITDSLVELPDPAHDAVIADISRFWQQRARYQDFGFVCKRGVLLYGPPGTGKTSILHKISHFVQANNGIVVLVEDPKPALDVVRSIRTVEPDRFVVVMLEDLDDIVSRYGDQRLLALMDGEYQIDNVLFLATTNYLDRIDKRLTARPSRFDRVLEVGFPPAPARRAFLEAKYPDLQGADLDRWVNDTEGYSIAALKELIIGVAIQGQPYDEVLARLHQLMKQLAGVEDEDEDEYEVEDEDEDGDEEKSTGAINSGGSD